MNQQPPDDGERTVIIPSPQGRSASATARASATPSGFATAEPPSAPSGINPLVAAANPLLNLVPQLRATLQHPDPVALRSALVRDIKAFETRIRAAGVDPDKVMAARYVLCTLLDEVAASTPWGESGVWGKQTLLVMFHNDTRGGKVFFQLLSKFAQNPTANRDILELLYICLALGFEGQYRVLDGGKAQLDSIRERLAQMLRTARGDYERDLSPAWRPAPVQRSRLFAVVPLWVSFAACGIVLLGAYFTFRYFLNVTSGPVFAAIQKIEVAKPARVAAPALRPRLEGLLKPDIDRHKVAVKDETDRSIITIVGDSLFASGSATISKEFEPVLHRVGQALEQVPGQIQVVGHTDNKPIRVGRFKSNGHLSRERARTVADMLAQHVSSAERITAEGRGDAEPIADNNKETERPRNRRVEITLLVPPERSNLR